MGGPAETDLRRWALELIGAARLEFRTLVAGLPAAERERAGELKRWAPKDEIAHLVYWLEVFVDNIRAVRGGEPPTDTRDYLALNDAAWQARKDWSLEQTAAALERVLAGLEGELERLSADELTEGPRPLLRGLLYELIAHPAHHLAGLHRKLGRPDDIGPMLARLQDTLTRRGVSRWAATTRGRLERLRG